MKSMLILNELHPIEQPGAATIAFDYASTLSSIMPTTFLFTSNADSTESVNELQLVGVRRKRRRTFAGYTGQVTNFIYDCFNFFQAYRYVRIISRLNTDVVWVHQIGNVIPRLTLYFLSKKVKVYLTLHDYGLIVPRKLYPRDLSNSILDRLGVQANCQKSEFSNSFMARLQGIYYTFRRSILKRLLKRCALIAISNLQSEIYTEFGFKISSVIANGIATCSCKSRLEPRQEKSILFVGRLIGKGLPRLLSSATQDDFIVYLAGDQELLEYALANSPMLNFVYLGRLERELVFETLHKIEFTYIASECFDVFPTIGIEAIRHGAIPITTETTGIRDLVRYIHPSLVLRNDESLVPLNELRQNFTSGEFDLNRAAKELATLENAVGKFLSFIRIS
jgi:hypothetical protein